MKEMKDMTFNEIIKTFEIEIWKAAIKGDVHNTIWGLLSTYTSVMREKFYNSGYDKGCADTHELLKKKEAVFIADNITVHSGVNADRMLARLNRNMNRRDDDDGA